MSSTTHAVIVGGGHNGLVCGSYLAQAGLRVTILERNAHIGGASVTQELLPGYQFSTFAYSANGPGKKIFDDLGIPEESVEVIPHDPTMFLPFPDGDSIVLWRDAERTAVELSCYGTTEADGYFQYREFMELAQEIAKSIFYRPPMTPTELHQHFQGTPHEAILEAILTRSHWDILCDYFSSDRVRCAFARSDDVGYPTAVGSLLAEVIESANDGVGRRAIAGVPVGGMGRITEVLADTARRHGASIRCNAPVRRVVVSSHRVQGVELEDGELINADLVISNADPKRTFLTITPKDSLPASFRDRISKLKTLAGNMKYHAALSGIPAYRGMPSDLVGDPRGAAAVRFSPSLQYMEQAWLDARSGIPSQRPVMSLQLPTAYVPDLAPAGMHIFGAWIRFAPGSPCEGNWDDWRPRVLESIHALMEEYAPGFSQLVEWERLYTPADIERETGITDASIRHLDMTLDQMLSRRPLPPWSAYATPLKGLWLCGSGTHPCGSVTGAPGHNAAQAVLEHLASR